MSTLVIGFALGVISMLVQSWWTDAVRDRRTRRRIARVLIPELRELSGNVMFLRTASKWDEFEFPPTSWAEHRTHLAEAARAADWPTIERAFDGVEEFEQEAKRHQWPEEIDPLWRDGLADTYQEIRKALLILHRYAGTSKPPRRVRRIRRRERFRAVLRSHMLA
jgi:hypothetical protein